MVWIPPKTQTQTNIAIKPVEICKENTIQISKKIVRKIAGMGKIA